MWEETSNYQAQVGRPAPMGEFGKTWKKIAKDDPTGFKNAQHAYIKRVGYDVMVSGIKNKLGIDINSRSSVLMDVIWSTAVQHGGYSSIVIDALKSQNISNLSDAVIIKLIYAERGKQNEKGELVHFIHSSKKTQKSISNRYKKEMNEALNKLKN